MCTTASDSQYARAVADFHSLPVDVVLRILLFCDLDVLFTCKRVSTFESSATSLRSPHTLGSLSQVSRSLQRLIDVDIYLQYKIELVLNAMVDGSASCSMNVVERMQLLRDYSARYHNTEFADSAFKYSWQRWPEIETMPTTDWVGLLGFGGSISYIVVKPPQKQISVCAPPTFTGPREMRDWIIPYEALSGRRGLVVVSVSVDLSQDLLLVAVQGEDSR